MNKIVLCCSRPSCPVVEKTKEGYQITDDYGGVVQLTKAEMRMLQDSDVDDLQIM